MNKLLLFASLLAASAASAQDWSYGLVVGANVFNDQKSNSGPDEVYFDSGNGDFAVLNIGGYVEYQLNTNMGIKTEVTYNKKEIQKGFSNSDLNEMYTLQYIDINPNFKYDFGQEYRSGFYLLLGPKIAILTNSTVHAPVNPEADTDDFRKAHVNIDLGFGWRIFKMLEIEGKFDYGLTPFYKDQYNGCKMAGAYLSVNVDLQRILFNQ